MVVSKKLIKVYGFSNIEEYFFYIVDSDINGNHKQKRELINKLSKEQKKEFLRFLEEWNISTISLIELL